MKGKVESKQEDMLLPNVKRMNLKVSMTPILDLWKRFHMSLGLGTLASSSLVPWSSNASCLQGGTVLFVYLFTLFNVGLQNS